MPSITEKSKGYRTLGLWLMVIGIVIFLVHHFIRVSTPEFAQIDYPACKDARDILLNSSTTITIRKDCWSGIISTGSRTLNINSTAYFDNSENNSNSQEEMVNISVPERGITDMKVPKDWILEPTSETYLVMCEPEKTIVTLPVPNKTCARTDSYRYKSLDSSLLTLGLRVVQQQK